MTTLVQFSASVKDTSDGDCMNTGDKSVGTQCKVKCQANYKPTVETTTCTFDADKLTSDWDQTLACEGTVISL